MANIPIFLLFLCALLQCVVGGCNASFASQGGLARHVPSHFSQQSSSKMSSQAKLKEESPSKAGLNKRKKLKNKRRCSLRTYLTGTQTNPSHCDTHTHTHTQTSRYICLCQRDRPYLWWYSACPRATWSFSHRFSQLIHSHAQFDTDRLLPDVMFFLRCPVSALYELLFFYLYTCFCLELENCSVYGCISMCEVQK